MIQLKKLILLSCLISFTIEEVSYGKCDSGVKTYCKYCYKDKPGECASCVSGAEKNGKGDQCKLCPEGCDDCYYGLDGNTEYSHCRECLNGYVKKTNDKNRGFCEKVTEIKNCISYVYDTDKKETLCDYCALDYTVSKDGKTCEKLGIENCRYGMISPEDNKEYCFSCESGSRGTDKGDACEKCSVSNCAACEYDKDQCTSCKEGYYLENWSSCKKCPKHCRYCDVNEMCSTCEPGYIAFEKKCYSSGGYLTYGLTLLFALLLL